MNMRSLNFKLFILISFFSLNFLKNTFAEDNYIVTIVNKIPITKVDVLNRAKLISMSIDKGKNLVNLKNYYNQSLNTLINEKIIFSSGKKISKDLDSIVLKQASQLLLAEFENSRFKLNEFIKKLAISETTLLEKYKAQLIWGIVLRNRYKIQFTKIEKNIEQKFKLNKKKENEDLYDLAEIVINKNKNSKLLENINTALNDGANFLDIAKQISISSSSKFGGKIGWNTFENLPEFLKKKGSAIDEGDFFSFEEKDKFRIIKILAKRSKGKLSLKEDVVLLAQVKFPINFQKQILAYEKIKIQFDNLLLNKNDCKILNNFNMQNNKGIELRVIKTRIADLNPKIQNIIENINLFKISRPIFDRNSGFAFIKCNIQKAKLKKVDYKELKNTMLNKYFIIYSNRLLKRLHNEANITQVEKIR